LALKQRSGAHAHILTWLAALAVISLAVNSALLCADTSSKLSPKRIVSMSLASDEILIDLLPMCGGISRIIALSKIVDDPKSSNVTDRARLIRGRVHSDIENIISYKPDLVIAASFNRQEVIGALKSRGVKTITLNQFSTVEDIAGNILKIGASIGCERPAEELHKNLLTRIKAVSLKTESQTKKPTILNYSSDLIIMGKNTLFNDIISKAGGMNAAALQGLEAWPRLDAETLVKMDPDYLVVLDDESASLKQAIKSHSIWKRLNAVRNDRFIFIRSRDAFSTSHYIASAVESLADALKARQSDKRK